MVKPVSTSKPELVSLAKSDERHQGLRSAFTSSAIGMGWQLAVVVLLGIVGGYKLDLMTDRSPLFTLVGLVLALIGSILVIRNALARVSNFQVPAKNSNERHDLDELGSNKPDLDEHPEFVDVAQSGNRHSVDKDMP